MKPTSIIMTAFLLIYMVSCTSTRITDSWQDPEIKTPVEHFNKVLAVALYKDESTRRVIEDELVKFMGGKAVASYSYNGIDVNNHDEKAVRDKLAKDGFDGAVTMRLVDVDKDISYTPGTISTYPGYYHTFGDYYWRGVGYYSTPGRFSTTQTYSVETNVYSIKLDKLIWSGLTKTTNPNKMEKMTQEIAEVVYKKMMKQGFVAE